jgi:hypothetical protein
MPTMAGAPNRQRWRGASGTSAMGKLLLGLTVLAAASAGLAALVLNQPLTTTPPAGSAVSGAGATLDHLSFAVGFFMGAVTLWIARMPFSAMGYVLLRWRLGWKFNWRRRAALAGLAAVACAVLYYY